MLVVEDDLLLLRSLTRLLRASGAQVTQVGSGLVAAQMAKVRTFDVVLTDLSMPEISGLEVAARMRDGDPALSVVLMTGSPSVDTAVRALELGALRYLVKPIAPVARDGGDGSGARGVDGEVTDGLGWGDGEARRRTRFALRPPTVSGEGDSVRQPACQSRGAGSATLGGVPTLTDRAQPSEAAWRQGATRKAAGGN